MLIKQKTAKQFTQYFLKKTGLGKRDNDLVSESLIRADMSNHFSHGIIRLIQYYKMVKKGIYKINRSPKIKKKMNNFLHVEGNRVFGQIAMNFACRSIIKYNKSISVTSVINTGHVGRLSDYSEILSRKGYVSIIFCNGGGPNTSIYPSRERLVGTNPFAFGVPVNRNKNFIVDFATSMLAEGKINLARLDKKKLTVDPIISKKGIFTNNAEDLYSGGALRTFGGIKGSAFCLVNEILGGLLISSNNPLNSNYLDGNNCLIISIKKKLFNYNKSFKNQFSKIEKKIKNSKKIKNFSSKKTFLPGEIEKEYFKISKTKGIRYNKIIIKKLNNFALEKFNIPKEILIR